MSGVPFSPGEVQNVKSQGLKRAALYLQDAHDLRTGLDYVQYAEQKGFEAVWQAESRLVRDAIVPMAAYAAVTKRIKVGSGVINNYLWYRSLVGSIGKKCGNRP
jgi:5,10-methylenetetrahydromethanopterin reductase